MNRISIYLMAGICCSGLLDARNTVLAAQETAKISVDQLNEAWEGRRTSVEEGKLYFATKRHLRSPTFAENGAASTATEKSERPTAPLSVTFKNGKFRLDGECVANIALGELGFMPQYAADEARMREEQFLSALYGYFQDVEYGPPPQLYTTVARRDEQIEVWQPTDVTFPKSVIHGPVSERYSQVVNGPAMASPSLHFSVLDASALSLYPRHLRSDSSSAVIADQGGGVAGKECIIVEEPFDGRWGKGLRRLWIDSSRGFLVLRCVLYGADQKPRRQYDIRYNRSRDNSPWLPHAIEIVQLDEKDNIFDSLSVEATVQTLSTSVDRKSFEVTLPAESWVIDQNRDDIYLLGVNAEKRFVSTFDIPRITSYEQLQAIAATRDQRMGNISSTMSLTSVVWLLKWPGILLTIGIGYCGVFLIRVLVRSRTSIS